MADRRSSAAYRIAFINFCAFAIGLAILGLVVLQVMHVAFTRELDNRLQDEAQTLASEYRSDDPGDLGEAIFQREAVQGPNRMLYAVFAPNGRRLFGSLQTTRPQLGRHDISFLDPQEGADSARAYALDLSPNERLVVAADKDWVERIDHIVEGIFAAAFAAACIAGLGGAAMFGRYLQRRLRSISDSAEAIIGGDIRQRMPVSARRDEFDQLASTLNRMLDRIEGLLENLRQVSSDVAHDLRTPLARLRNQLERGSQESRNAGAVIESAIHEVDEVLALFAAILRIAEVESGETRRFFALVDVSTLAAEIAESFAPSFEDEGRTLLWSTEPGLKVDGDRELLAQALVNLLENAQLHTSKGSVVRLTAVAAGNSICLQVVDNGPGVPHADLPRITRRFARLESSRNTAGHGLGLSLVSAVAKLHRGRLILKNSAPGLAATIELPRAGTNQQPNDEIKETI